MKKFFQLIVLGCAVLAAGCVDIDYTGQKYGPTPLSKEVKYLKGKENWSRDEYIIIGRFTLVVPEHSDHYTLEKELVEKGRAYGGDAVCLISSEIVEDGAYARNHEEFGAPHGKFPAPAVDPGQLGKPAPLTGEKTVMKRRKAKALLLKKREDVLKLLD